MTEQDKIVIRGMWEVIEHLHHTMDTTAKMVEWFYDIAPDAHKLDAAKRMDTFNKMMKSCDKLVAPMREILDD